jgi:hypothetical protein
MPYRIRKDDRCPAGKPWGVVGGSSGDRLFGCHPSEDAAKGQQAALYVHENECMEVPVSLPLSGGVEPLR